MMYAGRDSNVTALHPPPPCIHVVDDDAGVRTALSRLLGAHAYQVRAHASAEGFLAVYDPDVHGCIVLDIAMPGLDGIALQQQLARKGEAPPIVFLSGRADVTMCAGAIRCGAIDFLTKPVDEAALVPAICRALAQDAERRSARARQALTESCLASLTPREREVLWHVMDGKLNKQIAADIGTAEKTVKVHRARALQKMHVRSVAEVVRLVERARMAAVGALPAA